MGAVLFAGDLKVYNPGSGKYGAADGVYKVEGIHKVDENGEITYYIKADGMTRDAEQVYLHEKFHNAVHNNPELMGDFCLALQLEYGGRKSRGWSRPMWRLLMASMAPLRRE